jgi:hypothetical protein
MESSLTPSETHFLDMRSSIKWLLLELSLRLLHHNPRLNSSTNVLSHLISTLISFGASILSSPSSDQEFQLEAMLNTFSNLLDGIRDLNKLPDCEQVSKEIITFFLGRKLDFVGEDVSCLVKKRYLDVIVQLRGILEGEIKEKLWKEGLEVFMGAQVMGSGQASMIWYYLTSFWRFIEGNIKLLGEEECTRIGERILEELVPILVKAEENFASKTQILFQILGVVTQNEVREIECRVEATKKTFNFIADMFNSASTLFQYKLIHRCVVSFINKFAKPVHHDIGGLFYFIQEMFVEKFIKNYTIEDTNTDKVWNIQANIANSDDCKWLVEVRQIIFAIYNNVSRRTDSLTSADLFKISFPVLISSLHEDGDFLTGQEPKIEDILKWISTYSTVAERYNHDLLCMHRHVVYKMMKVCYLNYKKVIDEQHHQYSELFIENVSLWDNFLLYISKLIFMDISILIIPNSSGDSDFLTDLLEYLKLIIYNMISTRCTEGALQVVLSLVKELTPYNDEVEAIRKREIIGENYQKMDLTGKSVA